MYIAIVGANPASVAHEAAIAGDQRANGKPTNKADVVREETAGATAEAGVHRAWDHVSNRGDYGTQLGNQGWKCGDRRGWHYSFTYAAKVKPSCRASCTRFFGRPAFRAIRARKVECSKSATNVSHGRRRWPE